MDAARPGEPTRCTPADFARILRDLELFWGSDRTRAFQQKLGMELLGDPNGAGIPVIRDYSGPGADRLLFRRRL